MQEDQRLLEGSYRDIEYLTYRPLVSSPEVLSYFATTPFFDKNSSNNILFSQGIAQTPEMLATLTGIEYQVDEAMSKPPHLFIIVKQIRHNVKETEMQEMFYCLDGSIMRCTNFRDVLHARFQKLSFALDSAISSLAHS